MQKYSIIEPRHLKSFRLRYIEERDLDLLRTWKNKNRKRFFYQDEISPAQQKRWFLDFFEKPDELMYMVESIVDATPDRIGCMGFRSIDNNSIDIYNVIRGKTVPNGITMGEALHLMLNFIVSRNPIKEILCKVLPDNPAVRWYEKNGFTISEIKPNYLIMTFNKNKLQLMEFIAR